MISPPDDVVGPPDNPPLPAAQTPPQSFPSYPQATQYPGYPPATQQAPPVYYPPPPNQSGAPYPSPQYGYGPVQHGDGLGVAALVLGIVGAVLAFGVIGIVPAILAIIFGTIVRRRASRGTAKNGGQALAGLILGIVGVVASLGMLAVYTVAAVHRNNCENHATTQQDFDRCSD